MPFLTNDKNFRKVMQTHLHDGESIEHLFGAGRRVIALTSGRLLVSNFPFFFSPKLLLEAPIEQIESLDSVQSKSMSMDMIVGVGGQTLRAELPTSYSDVPQNLDVIFTAIREKNPAAGGASYFEEGETEIAGLPTKEGSLKMSDRHLYLVGEKPAADGSANILAKVPLGAIQELDAYQGRMNSTILSLTVQGQSPRTLTVPGTANDMNDFGIQGTFWRGDWVPAKMLAYLEQIGVGARPHYLQDGEELMYSVRAGKGMLGGVNANGHLRLTSHRLLDMKPGDDGRLALEASLPRAEVAGINIVEQQGEYGNALHFEVTFELAGGGSAAFVVPSENETTLDRLVGELT
jgi:hypothetical protein